RGRASRPADGRPRIRCLRAGASPSHRVLVVRPLDRGRGPWPGARRRSDRPIDRLSRGYAPARAVRALPVVPVGRLMHPAAFLPFFSTLAGGFAALRLRHRLHALMALAAGVVVATAVADLLPEALELVGNGAAIQVGGAAVLGFIGFS